MRTRAQADPELKQNDGNGGFINDTTFNINISPVNDAPTLTVPGTQTTAHDMALEFIATNGNDFSFDDLDVGTGLMQVSIGVTNGTLTISGGTNGLTFTTGDGTDDASMNFTGTLADLQVALSSITFNPTTSFIGTAVLTFIIRDQGNSGSGGIQEATGSVNITVT